VDETTPSLLASFRDVVERSVHGVVADVRASCV